jgi:hypothetical protein
MFFKFVDLLEWDERTFAGRKEKKLFSFGLIIVIKINL